MITVSEAEKIIAAEVKNYGTEVVPIEAAAGRILADAIKADRAMPPFNRVTMDGIAINFTAIEKGIRSFKIKATQAAGKPSIDIEQSDECIEIMTGAVLPSSTDTIIRYEDVIIKDRIAKLQIIAITKGQNIHPEGADKKKGAIVAASNQVITPALLATAASVGAYHLTVKKLPKIIVITTGDELVEVWEQPLFYQIRKSNNYFIKAVLQLYGIEAAMIHLRDAVTEIEENLQLCLAQYDVVLVSGGISMGKFDYIPQALQTLSVQKLFHKVQQRPGKPFWFGKHTTALVFAFPGNPVSTFMCLHRFFIPWLQRSLGITASKLHAVLADNITFTPPLTYFLQVHLTVDTNGKIWAHPAEGNGSGDFANLVGTDAFMELPAEQDNFDKGQVFRIWPFKKIL